MKLLADRILIQPIEEKYEGSIIIPETGEQKVPERGVVLAKGPDVSGEVPLKSQVIFLKYEPQEIEITEIIRRKEVRKKYLIAREKDILAVIED